MRSLLSVGLLVLTGSVFACKYEVPAFRLSATDGKTYTEKSLVGKPTFIFFLKKNCPANPKATPGINGLAKELAGKAQVLVVMDGTLAEVRANATKVGLAVPVLADIKGVVIRGFKAERGADFTFVATKTGKPRYPEIWTGVSRAHLEEAVAAMRKHGATLPALKLASISKSTISGCMF